MNGIIIILEILKRIFKNFLKIPIIDYKERNHLWRTRIMLFGFLFFAGLILACNEGGILFPFINFAGVGLMFISAKNLKKGGQRS